MNLRTTTQKALCLVTLCTHTAVVPLFIYIVYEWYVGGRLEIFLAFVVLLIAPMLVVNLVSAIMLLRRDEFAEKFTVQNLCIVAHILQMGLLCRVASIFQSFSKTKVLEFSLLAVGQAASSFLPAILLQGVLLKPMLPHIPTTAQGFIAVCIISSALSFVQAQIALKSSRENEERSSPHRQFLLLTFCHIGGVLCLLISRCLSIVLFSYILTYWIALLISTHFLLCLVSSLVYTHLQLKKVHIMRVLRQTGLMFLHIYDALSADSGPGKCANVLFYTLLLVENILMSAVWVMTSRQSDVTKLVTVMIMLATFVVGVVLKFLCYSCGDDESTAEDSDRKALDVRAVSSVSISQRSVRSSRPKTRHTSAKNRDNQNDSEINSTSATVCASVSKTTAVRKALAASKLSKSPAVCSKKPSSPRSYSNPAYDDTEITYREEFKDKSRVKGRKEGNRKPSSDTLEGGQISKSKTKRSHQNRKTLKAQRGYCSEELTDIGSSNSRNTNTLDMSGQSGQSNLTGNNSSGKPENYCTPRRPATHAWKERQSPDNAMNYTAFVITSSKNQRAQNISKSCAPLSRLHYVESTENTNDQSVERRQHESLARITEAWYPHRPFDQYSNDFYTDTTSYYDTLSYYYTVTSSHSSSDSDCARTWPPSQSTAFQQSGALQLPNEKLSPEERISIWLQRSRQFFSQDFLNQSVIYDSATVSSRFGSNRRTICGYQTKVSFSSTSSRRVPPRGIKPRQRPQFVPGQTEEYRIQFQTYMDSLKTRKKYEGVWACYPVHEKQTNTKPELYYVNETHNQNRIYENWPTYQRRTRAPSKSVPPPRPPRPARNIQSSVHLEEGPVFSPDPPPGLARSRLLYDPPAVHPGGDVGTFYSHQTESPIRPNATGLESAV